MIIKFKKYVKVGTLLPVVLAVACSAGPTKRYVDGKWQVSENICSSDPSQADLGDMRSEIRQHLAYETSYTRRITFFYLDRTILDVTQKFNSSSGTGEMKLYANSAANPVAEIIKIQNTRELNNIMESGVEQFFSNDSNIDGKAAHSFCLYRGQ